MSAADAVACGALIVIDSAVWMHNALLIIRMIQ